MNRYWDWGFFFEIMPRILQGAVNTIMAALGGYALAVIGGLLVALLLFALKPSAQIVESSATLRMKRILTFIIKEIIEFIRSTPLLIQVFFIFYVGPQFGITLSPWAAGLIAISLHYTAYLSEVFRGGLEAVPKGQWEASISLSLSPMHTFFRIITPQAIIPSIGGLGNYLIGIFKDTPMLSAIALAEMMFMANAIGGEHYRYTEPYTMVGLIFLIISLPMAGFIRAFERFVRRRMGLA